MINLDDDQEAARARLAATVNPGDTIHLIDRGGQPHRWASLIVWSDGEPAYITSDVADLLELRTDGPDRIPYDAAPDAVKQLSAILFDDPHCLAAAWL